MAGIGIRPFGNGPQMGIAVADLIIEQGKPNLPPVPEYDTYTVKRGDSLSSIAAKVLGSSGRWKEIWNINSDIADPNQIEVGQVINIPAGAVAVSSDPAKSLPGPRVTAVETLTPRAGDDDVQYMDDTISPASSFLSSPAVLVGAAGIALLIIMMATRKSHG